MSQTLSVGHKKDVTVSSKVSSLDKRILLQHVLGVTYEHIIANPNQELPSIEKKKYQTYLNRRLSNEPIAKIIGEKEFWSLSFKTTQDTLDPRPDSETLIETALKLFPDKDASLSILDIGTGTGCLLLSLLHEYTNATGVGTDISTEALAVAQENAKRLGLNNRVKLIKSDWTDEVSETFDMIVSNPPYIESDVIPTLEPEVAKYDPHIALDGGADGLTAYRTLAPQLASRIKADGKILLEIGQGQGRAVAEILAHAGLQVEKIIPDYAGIERCLVTTTSL